ncbi:MAG: hypothetical protein Q4E65_00620 [Clostridia bacterium]|nr:hypothetical protein [Clostridia bacterium]
MTNLWIIILGVAAAFVLLSGVAVTAYSRIKSFGRHGAKLDELLTSIEDELEATHVADQLSAKRKPKEKEKTAAEKSDEKDEATDVEKDDDIN